MSTDLRLTSGTSTSTGAFIGNPTSANTGTTSPAPGAPGLTAEQVENALYGYVQGMRALGRTKINIAEAAHALHVSESLVLAAAHALKSKGVEVI